MGVLERKILRKVYGLFCDSREWRIRWNQELNDRYDDIDVVERIKIQRLRWLGLSLVWIGPTQFVKSSNLSQVVDVADKDGLPSVEPNRLMRI